MLLGAAGTQLANITMPFVHKMLEGIGEDLAAEWVKENAGGVGQKLMCGVQGLAYYPRVFTLGMTTQKLSETDHGSADKLKRMLEKGGTLAPRHVSVTGKFMPGSLLQFGWWERKSRALLNKNVAWRSDRPIQRWLFSGFEQWAPSWDINDWNIEGAKAMDAPFIAQIGFHDEADSFPVIMLGSDKTRAIRTNLQEIQHDRGIVACKARVSGVLCSAKYFARIIAPDKAELVKELLRNDGLPPYGIIVREEDVRDAIQLYPNQEVDLYSGYIWRCLCPDKDYSPKGNSISDCYFIWEHTNLADRDCIQYNLDSLDRKQAFITERLKDRGMADKRMRKLQELTPDRRLRGSDTGEAPLLPSSQFLNIFTKGLDYPDP
jgi:hypothetical protein